MPFHGPTVSIMLSQEAILYLIKEEAANTSGCCFIIQKIQIQYFFYLRIADLITDVVIKQLYRDPDIDLHPLMSKPGVKAAKENP